MAVNVARADGDDIQRFLRQHFAVVGVGVRSAYLLLSRSTPGRVRVGHRYRLHAVDTEKSEVKVVAEVTAASMADRADAKACFCARGA